MKCKDLRLGNYIRYFDEEIGYQNLSIISVDESYVMCWDKNEELVTIEESELEPVKITQDILLNLGFDEFGIDPVYNHFRFELDDVIVHSFKEVHNLSEQIYLDFGSGIDIDYVHELQNLVYFIYGIELKFK